MGNKLSHCLSDSTQGLKNVYYEYLRALPLPEAGHCSQRVKGAVHKHAQTHTHTLVTENKQDNNDITNVFNN